MFDEDYVIFIAPDQFTNDQEEREDTNKQENTNKTVFLDTKIYLMLLNLCRALGNQSLTMKYSGSGDSGSVDDIFLYTKGEYEPVTGLVFKDQQICLEEVANFLIDFISDHTWLCISFDNEGSHGCISVKAEENSLVIDCNHVYYGGSEFTELDEEVFPVLTNHTTLRLLDRVLEHQFPPIGTHEELCSLFHMLGFESIRAYKEDSCVEFNIEFSLCNPTNYFADQTDKHIEETIQTLLEAYFESSHSNCSLEDMTIDMRFERIDRETYVLFLESEVRMPDSEPEKLSMRIVFSNFN